MTQPMTRRLPALLALTLALVSGRHLALEPPTVALVEAAVPTDESSCLPRSQPDRSLVFPDPDPALQRHLDDVLATAPYDALVGHNQLSIVLADISEPCRLRYSGVHDDQMRYAASLPKIAILLAVFEQIHRGILPYTPELRAQLERMIRQSSNPDSTALIRRVGFATIANVLQDPRYQLYDLRRQGGLWVGKDYGGGLGRWKRDPLHHVSHGATARQVARFFVMLNRGELVSPWASAEMKEILGHSKIHHKFVRGLDQRPGSRIYRKSGTWQRWHADAALVERGDRRYVAVALLEGSGADAVLSDLILKLDDLVSIPSD